MGWSRSGRIKTLLAIDGVFFLIEIVAGYAVGSLALVADSFHMLNDCFSLVVALYAIKLSSSRSASEHYSYGWQRAEVLGALINGVFLLALCLSIFLEAVSRFFEPNDVRQPKLVVLVGCLGLASNIIGLFLFHDHGHGGHSHGHTHTHAHKHVSPHKPKDAELAVEEGHGRGLNERTPLLSVAPATTSGSSSAVSSERGSEDDDEDNPLEDLFVHPAQARDNIIRAAEQAQGGSSASEGQRQRSRSLHSAFGTALPNEVEDEAHERSKKKRKSHSEAADEAPAQLHDDGHADADSTSPHHHAHDEPHAHNESHDHAHESHANAPSGDGHSHGSMNMRGVFLHVMGDALGNVGVIAAGLIIWLTSWKWRFLFDPFISLVITCIIFASALPLVKSASFILLQGTPYHVPLSRVRRAILAIPGVISIHELHIWSLSESKLVASVHVLVGSQEDYVTISRGIRRALHRCGIHSSTIQPEILGSPGAASRVPLSKGLIPPDLVPVASATIRGSGDEVIAAEDLAGCLVQCEEDCGAEACCPPGASTAASNAGSIDGRRVTTPTGSVHQV